jgi:hypothetical protein
LGTTELLAFHRFTHDPQSVLAAVQFVKVDQYAPWDGVLSAKSWPINCPFDKSGAETVFVDSMALCVCDAFFQ